jgi:hypothetical protein
MITPRPDLKPISELPPLNIPSWKWTVGRFVAPLVRRRLKSHYDARMKHAATLMSSLRACTTREALESLLAPPQYAVDARLYACALEGGESHDPDTVEIYLKDGCTFQLHFKNGTLISYTASAFPTIWEIATGAINGTRSADSLDSPDADGA